MAETSAHDKEMENFMGTEILVSRIENRQFQGVDDAAQGVNDASGQKPQKACFWQRCQYL